MNLFRHLHFAQKQSLAVLFGAGFLFWTSLSLLLPTLSLYLKDIEASDHQIGMVMGAFAIGLLLFRPWLGNVADQHGRRLVLLIGVLVAAIAPLGYLLTTSLPLLAGVRIFHGISIAAFTTAYSALVVDLSPPEQRGEVIGTMSLVTPIGMAVGPALGGYVQAALGYTPLFLLASGLGLAACGCTLGVQNSAKAEFLSNETAKAQSFWRLILSERFRVPTLLLLAIGLAFGTLSTFLPLFIQQTRVTLNPGLFYTTAAIFSFLVRLPTGRASDRYGRGRFITVSLILYTAAMLILWRADQASLFLLAGAWEGAGAGIFLPMMIALLADRSQPQERGRVFGLCIAGFDLGMAIAGPTFGFVAAQMGYRELFGMAGGLALLALLVFVSQGNRSMTTSLQFALGNGKDVFALERRG